MKKNEEEHNKKLIIFYLIATFIIIFLFFVYFVNNSGLVENITIYKWCGDTSLEYNESCMDVTLAEYQEYLIEATSLKNSVDEYNSLPLSQRMYNSLLSFFIEYAPVSWGQMIFLALILAGVIFGVRWVGRKLYIKK